MNLFNLLTYNKFAVIVDNSICRHLIKIILVIGPDQLPRADTGSPAIRVQLGKKGFELYRSSGILLKKELVLNIGLE